jgi:hypothetical protein
MKKMIALLLFTLISLAGCSSAVITSAKWDTGITSNAVTRCERVDLRDKADMNTALAKYDGWKLVYISEYTTEHKSGTDAAVCFERAKTN